MSSYRPPAHPGTRCGVFGDLHRRDGCLQRCARRRHPRGDSPVSGAHLSGFTRHQVSTAQSRREERRHPEPVGGSAQRRADHQGPER